MGIPDWIFRPWSLISGFLSHRGLRAKPSVWLMISSQPQEVLPAPCGGSSSSLPCLPLLCVPTPTGAFRVGAVWESVVARPLFSASDSSSLCACGQLFAPVWTSAFPSCRGDDTPTLHVPNFDTTFYPDSKAGESVGVRAEAAVGIFT